MQVELREREAFLEEQRRRVEEEKTLAVQVRIAINHIPYFWSLRIEELRISTGYENRLTFT